MSKFLYILAVAGLIGLAFLVGLYIASPKAELLPQPDWPVYKSPAGGFSFRYPPGYSAGDEAKDTEDPAADIIFIHRVNPDGAPVKGPPAMQITIYPVRRAVTFALWEGIEWGHENGVIHSFTFNK